MVYAYGCNSRHSKAAGSFPDMQELSVFPAEIIKMLALVGFKPNMKRFGVINAGNRTTDSDREAKRLWQSPATRDGSLLKCEGLGTWVRIPSIRFTTE